MKAVILAGGRGERLRPITDTRPKPLVPVLARPVLDYCLSLLAHHGVKEVYITTCYLAEQIRRQYGNRAFGMAISYSLEDTPCGTAGAVKRWEKELQGEECFLVMSGDALCDFDLTQGIAFHREKDASVTVILSSVKTPLEYGVVMSDPEERILAFSEKPDWSETFSDWVNTGTYILSPRVLQYVPEGRPFDFSCDLFPLLLQKEEESLYGYKDEGYWCDIGRISAWYRCNQDLLQGKVRTHLSHRGRICQDPKTGGISFVSDTARLEEDVQVGAGCVISPRAILRRGTQTEGSLILEDALLDQGVRVKDSVVCEGVHAKENARILSGSVLGGKSIAEKGAHLSGEKLPPLSRISSEGEPFFEEGILFTERGILTGKGERLSHAEAERLGCAFARFYGDRIGVLWAEETDHSRALATVVAGGVTAGGADAVLLGEGERSVASFAACRFDLPVIFVQEKAEGCEIRIFHRDGFPLSRKATLRLGRCYEENTPAPTVGRLHVSTVAAEEYVNALSRLLGKGTRRIGIVGDRSHSLKEAAIKSGFRAYNGFEREGPAVGVYSTGVKVYWDGVRLADTENARLFLIRRELESGRRTFALPRYAPEAFTQVIEKAGGRAIYFSLHHSVHGEDEARCRGALDRWLFDDVFLAAQWLRTTLCDSPNLLQRELQLTPPVYITRLSYVPKGDTKARLLCELAREQAKKKGIHIETGYYGIRIVSEAANFEAALDHAFRFRGKINEIEEKLEGR